MSRRDEILDQIRSIDALPAAATELMRMMDDPDVEIGAIVRTIEVDPGLTSNVLRMANSAYFAGPRSISSLQDATVRLGLNRLFQLVMASTVAPLTAAPVKGYDLPPGDLLEHSIAVAIGTEQLAAVLELKTPSYAFTAALLHDIGKVIMGTFIDVDAKPILKMAFQERISFERAEAHVLGINHAEVGAAVLESWNLPATVVDVVRWHHEPENHPGDSMVVDLVHVADGLAMLSGLGTGIDGLNYRPSQKTIERLGISTRITEQVVSRILSGLDEVRSVLPTTLGREKR